MLRSQKHIFECRINFFKNYKCKFCSFISSNRKNVELHLKNFKHVEKKSKQKVMKTSVTIIEDMQINKNVPSHRNIFGVQTNIKIEDKKSEQVKHLKIPNTIKKLRNVIDIDGLKSDGNQQDIVFMDSRSQQENKSVMDTGEQLKTNVLVQGTSSEEQMKIQNTDSVTGELCGTVPISNCMMGIDQNMGIGGETDDFDLQTMTSQMFDEALSISWWNDLLYM